MKKFLQLLTLICFAGIFISANHPVYLTVTEIEHNATAQSLEISCKFYVEDFEKTLRQVYTKKVDLMGSKTDASNDKLISTYVSEHFIIKINDKQVVLKYAGFNIENEALYAFFEVQQVNAVKKIHIRQDLLFAQFDEQMGIIHLKAGGKTKSTKLQNPTAEANFNLPL